MKIHYLQHVEFENLANIEQWAKSKNHAVSKTLLYENQLLPELDSFDLLIVLGGPMNIYQEDKYSWLKQEKAFLKRAINAKKHILGICLGAQLLADALGAKVYPNEHKEIGWLKIEHTDEALNTDLFCKMPKQTEVFQWHGDTFDMPANTIKIAFSEACLNQGFIYEQRIIALQYHLESSRSSIENLLKNCSDELIEGKYVQSYKEITAYDKISEIEKNLHILLNNLEQKIKRERKDVSCKN